MPRELSAYFEDICIACDKIERYTKGMNKEALSHNDLVLDAVVNKITPLKNTIEILQDRY